RPVQAYNKQNINLKGAQAVTVHKQHIYKYIKAKGDYDEVFDGGDVEIEINANCGGGHPNNSILYYTMTNSTGSDIDMVSDPALHIDHINVESEVNVHIQKIYGKEQLY